MDSKEKLEALKRWLTENGHPYVPDAEVKGFRTALVVKDPQVAVMVAETNQEFFHAVKRTYAPFFIREAESIEFIIEKMGNCIRDAKAKKEGVRARKPAPKIPVKHKRKRIVRAEKV